MKHEDPDNHSAVVLARHTVEADLILVRDVLAQLRDEEEALTGWWDRETKRTPDEFRSWLKTGRRLLQREIDRRLQQPTLDQASIEALPDRKFRRMHDRLQRR